MRSFLSVCTGLFVASVSALAQAPDSTSRWNAYAFLAPGTSTHFESGRATVHIGGGAERFIYQGLSVGAEVGPVITWTAPGRAAFNPFSNDRVHGLFSPNIAYHFVSNTTDRKLDPFLTGGYSLFFGIGNDLVVPGRGFTNTQSGYNVGGGANFWILRKAAMRLEFRQQSSVWYKTMDVRVGMTFR